MDDALTDHARLLAACSKWEQLYREARSALQQEGDYAATAHKLAAEVVLLRRALGALCDIDDAFAAHTAACQMSPCRTCNEHAETQEYAFIDAKELLRGISEESALQRILAAHQAFVDAHGPLVDYSPSAEMVDFDIALGAALEAAFERALRPAEPQQ